MRILAICLSLTLAASTTRADMLSYIEWIEANTNMVYNGEPLPTIEYLDYPHLELLVYGDHSVAQAEHNGTELPRIMAAYDANVIYFPTGADLTDPHTEATLVHELVHYMQDINGLMTDCPGAAELPAYKLHEQWMIEHNVPGDRPNLLWAALMGMACERYDYYPGHPP